jgi:hypothetical protein
MSEENWEILQKLQTDAARWKQSEFVEHVKARVAEGATPAALAEELSMSEWYVLRMWKSRFGRWVGYSSS